MQAIFYIFVMRGSYIKYQKYLVYDSQRRFITASAFGQLFGAYYHGTSFRKRNYCLLPSLSRWMRCKFATLGQAALCVRPTRALAARAISISLSEMSITRYRVVNIDIISGRTSAFSSLWDAS